MLIAVLHLIPDEDDPWRIVASFMDGPVRQATWCCPTRPATWRPTGPPRR
jgi:hypothetical protein